MGGANAPITTETSVRGLGKVIDDLTCEASGRFYAFDGGGSLVKPRGHEFSGIVSY